MAKKIKVSDESLNSYNLRIQTAGIELGRFKRNPIMLFNHQRATRGTEDDILPIGTWIDLLVEGTDMYAVPVFDMADDFAAKIAGKFDRGVLRAASIGIYVKEVVEMSNGDGTFYYLVTKCELREISIVDIPSNEFAVTFYDENDEPVEAEFVLALAADSKPKTILPMSKTIQPIMLGLAADATQEIVDAEIKNLMDIKAKYAAKESEVTTLKAEVTTLKDAEKARVETDNEDLVNAAIADNRIDADEKEDYLNLLSANPETGKKILAKQTAKQTIKEFVAGGGKNSEGTYQGLTFKELQEKDSAKLAALKVNDFEQFKTLYKESYGTDYKG